jgi:transposase-like protein
MSRRRVRAVFPVEVKEAAVERYLTSDLTLTAVGEQFGVSRYSVAAWIKQAEKRTEMSKKKKQQRDKPSVPTDQRSASEKLRLLIESSVLSDEALGEFLRREGLREGDLERFRAEAMGGLGGKVYSEADRRRIQELERANAKQGKRLREAEALLDLQKKSKRFGGQRTTTRPTAEGARSCAD